MSAAVLCLAMSSIATASDYAVFCRDLAAPYSDFKKSLSLTSKKEDSEKAKLAINSFISGWEKLASRYASDAPTVFAAEKDFQALINRPVAVGKEAAALMAKGEIKAAHNLLEEVRYLMWQLRVTNGVVSLADKVNNFHEAMEIVLDKADETKDPAKWKAVEYRYGAWLAVTWEELNLAPAQETSSPAFKAAFKDGRDAIKALRAALVHADQTNIKQSGSAVKTAYKKVFFLD